MPSHQKRGHTNPIVAAWEGSGQRGAHRAAQREVLRDMMALRNWRWHPAYLDGGYWRYYGYDYGPGLLSGASARPQLLSEIERRIEKLLCRLPQNIRDQLVALGDRVNVEVIERALRRALPAEPERRFGTKIPPLYILVADKIGDRRKEKLRRELGKCAAYHERHAAGRGAQSRTALWLRRIIDQLERGEEIDGFDSAVNGSAS